MTKLMIYGAAGYTGGMAAENAASAGLPLVLAARAEDQQNLEALADRLGAPVRVFSLGDPDATQAGLADISVLLNAAGPFANTAEPLMSVNFHAELTRVFHRELTHLRVMFRGSGLGQGRGCLSYPPQIGQ